MTDEQYEKIMAQFERLAKNQIIIDNKVNGLEQKINTLQSDMQVAINNELILGRDQDIIMADVKTIKSIVNK